MELYKLFLNYSKNPKLCKNSIFMFRTKNEVSERILKFVRVFISKSKFPKTVEPLEKRGTEISFSSKRVQDFRLFKPDLSSFVSRARYVAREILYVDHPGNGSALAAGCGHSRSDCISLELHNDRE